ncbi:hypothetical protein C0989_003111 [Termitomyces sp. Mn162]|nr:hypothetical protein C0989_003111 [Termitomyces sp. Mn162]
MVWLDGKPTLAKAFAWPVDDPDLKSQDRKRQGWSVLDDQILFWRAFPSSENPRTVIYVANTTFARDTQSDTITLERVAELDYAAHRLAIVLDVGFVTAEWRGTGEFLRECHCPAQASYGKLSVLGQTVSLCVTSTDPIPPDVCCETLHYRRLDYDPGYTDDLPNDLVAETIATWNADSGDLRMVKIPRFFLENVAHEADFQYISPHKIVLASSLESTSCGAVLCAFSANAEDEEPLMFYHGQHTDPHVIRKDIQAERTMIFVLDFDQTLLASLLSKQPSERAEWNEQLVDSRAQVKVVTRRFHCAVDGEIWDQEYPLSQQAPPEWEAHLDTILKEDEDEDEEMDDSDSDEEVLPSGLEYDEAPEEHREPVPFGYVQTTLRLEGITNAKRLAITKHAILELPEFPKENGHVFYFD